MLADGTSALVNPSRCDDALASMSMAKTLGAEINQIDETLFIKGGMKFRETLINCGESGLLARLMIPLASLTEKEITLTGEGTLLKRQTGRIEGPLRQLGVKCISSDGFMPVILNGPLHGTKIEVDGSESSQFISGLLMACPLVKDDSEIVVNDLKSRPYVDLTIDILKKFGVQVENRDYRSFVIRGNQKYRSTKVILEGDWSGASFLLVAAAINGKVRLTGLNLHSEQADRNILAVLTVAGAQVSWNDDEISIHKSRLSSFEFDATDCPDLFPPLAVLAAAADGVSRIKGVDRLQNKESNRGLTLQKELGKLGVEIILEGNFMKVTGGVISGGTVFSHNDHRIAMAAAVAGLIAKGPVMIESAECVSKSWPSFFDDLRFLNVNIYQK